MDFRSTSSRFISSGRANLKILIIVSQVRRYSQFTQHDSLQSRYCKIPGSDSWLKEQRQFAKVRLSDVNVPALGGASSAHK